MDVACAVCGVTFQARSKKARYCSDRCRKRKDKAEVVQLNTAADDLRKAFEGGVTAATTAELEAAGRLDTALGQACLVLARRLDFPGLDTGSAVASVARQLDAMMATATRGAGQKTAPQQLRDELAERRAKHA